MALVLRLVAVLLACAWAYDVDQACSEDADGTAPAKTCLMQARVLGGIVEGEAVAEPHGSGQQHHWRGDEPQLNQEDEQGKPGLQGKKGKPGLEGKKGRNKSGRLNQEGEELKEEGEDGPPQHAQLNQEDEQGNPNRRMKRFGDLITGTGKKDDARMDKLAKKITRARR